MKLLDPITYLIDNRLSRLTENKLKFRYIKKVNKNLITLAIIIRSRSFKPFLFFKKMYRCCWQKIIKYSK